MRFSYDRKYWRPVCERTIELRRVSLSGSRAQGSPFREDTATYHTFPADWY
jgi:hypothetical protein